MIIHSDIILPHPQIQTLLAHKKKHTNFIVYSSFQKTTINLNNLNFCLDVKIVITIAMK
jgi:hypothetical protein